MVSGIGTKVGNTMNTVMNNNGTQKTKNEDISEYDQAEVDPAWLETNSPMNRQVMEDAYKQYPVRESQSTTPANHSQKNSKASKK